MKAKRFKDGRVSITLDSDGAEALVALIGKVCMDPTNTAWGLFNALADDADVPWGPDNKYDVVQSTVAHRDDPADLAVDIVEKTK